VESLAKKYDEKYRAAADVNTQLAAGEAAYREIQVVFVYDGKKIHLLENNNHLFDQSALFSFDLI
jgi:hypothetical protein